jgi:hypothetical protein
MAYTEIAVPFFYIAINNMHKTVEDRNKQEVE